MKIVTGYDVISDDKLVEFLHNAYVNNEDVLIPKELLKDFVQIGCRKSMLWDSAFTK